MKYCWSHSLDLIEQNKLLSIDLSFLTRKLSRDIRIMIFGHFCIRINRFSGISNSIISKHASRLWSCEKIDSERRTTRILSNKSMMMMMMINSISPVSDLHRFIEHMIIFISYSIQGQHWTESIKRICILFESNATIGTYTYIVLNLDKVMLEASPWKSFVFLCIQIVPRRVTKAKKENKDVNTLLSRFLSFFLPL